MNTSAIEALIYERTGLTFDAHRFQILNEAVARHMARLDISDMDGYRFRLVRDPALFDDLVDRLTINETYFFREPVHLDLLCRRLVPERMEKTLTQRIHIVSAGCATGEEPCSMAMALDQALGRAVLDRIDITGMDIDGTTLDIARAGIYGKSRMRQLSQEMVQRYFDPVSALSFAVKPGIRQRIFFRRFNLLQPPPPEMVQGVDILFYRNVSIYFDKPVRVRVFKNLSQMLKPGGYLVVGSAETMGHDAGCLELVELDGCFVYYLSERVGVPGTESRLARGSLYKRVGKPDTSSGFGVGVPRSESRFARGDASAADGEDESTAVEKIYQEALALIRQKQFDRAGNLLTSIEKIGPDMVEKVRLLQACLLFQREKPRAAADLCRQLIRDNVRCAPAYLLSGIVEKNASMLQAALKRFRETLYVDPANGLAHFLLFQTLRELEDDPAARRQAGVVVRLFESGKVTPHGLEGLFFSFSMADISGVCRRYLASTHQSEETHGL